MKPIYVIGSFMMDQITRAKRAPNAGETLIGESFHKAPGGKGANQAVSAARLGGHVTMAGAVGEDDNGAQFLRVFKAEGIDISHVKVCLDYATGIGNVVLDDSGQNRIIVVPGANLHYEKEDVQAFEASLPEGAVVVCQLEIPLATVDYVADLVKRKHGTFILNPAPFQPLSDALLSKVDYLTPNETELSGIAPGPQDHLEEVVIAGQKVLAKGVKHLVVTLGSRGSLYLSNEGSFYHHGYKVKAIDTVGAGDAFNGALAYGLALAWPASKILEFANAVGALSTTKEGAIPSLPYLQDVEAFLAREPQKALPL